MAGQPNRNHANVVLLADREMPVVAGRGAKEQHRLPIASPRSGTLAYALEQTENDRVVHQRKARIVSNQHLLRRCAKDRREQATRLNQSLRTAIVVATIRVLLGDAILGANGHQELV